jgi:hypothetical protein
MPDEGKIIHEMNIENEFVNHYKMFGSLWLVYIETNPLLHNMLKGTTTKES